MSAAFVLMGLWAGITCNIARHTNTLAFHTLALRFWRTLKIRALALPLGCTQLRGDEVIGTCALL